MKSLQQLKETVATLRGPGGCPWDIEQTHESICDCLIEEVSELLDTIDRADMEHMKEELGDLLLHVLFHSQIAAEAGHFELEDVAAGINEKLIRRHPHVFGEIDLDNSEDVLAQWEQIKSKENETKPKEQKEIPNRLPALLYATKVHKRLEDKPVINESSITEEEAGKALYELAMRAKKSGVDPESALRRYASGLMCEVVEG